MANIKKLDHLLTRSKFTFVAVMQIVNDAFYRHFDRETYLRVVLVISSYACLYFLYMAV